MKQMQVKKGDVLAPKQGGMGYRGVTFVPKDRFVVASEDNSRTVLLKPIGAAAEQMAEHGMARHVIALHPGEVGAYFKPVVRIPVQP